MNEISFRLFIDKVVEMMIETNNLEQSKLDLIADITRRVEDKIIEQSNADLLIKLINQADTLTEAIAIAELGTTYKRTGLHFDKRLEKFGNTIKYLSKNDELSFKTSKDAITHKLIIGDNYDALLNLLVSYRGMIDVIYIDPPYGKDSMGEFAQTNYDNALTRDNLLSMMYPRLVLAKQLLSESGIIFVSIDDKNEAYIKCLMDEIFEESNFVASCPRKTVSSKTTKSDHELQKLYDYLLIYVRSNNSHFTKNIVGTKRYPYHDERGDYYLVPLQDNGPHGTRTARPNLWYPIYKTKDDRMLLERESEEDVEYLPTDHKGDAGRWMWSKKKFLTDSQDLVISDNGIVSIKHYYIEGDDTNKYQPWKDWLDKYLNATGTTQLSEIVGKHIFDNPKPVDLVKWCINLHPNTKAVVLDFFAGSGTTGQAVLDLNKDDNGNRQFILCTNNEITPSTPNGVVKDVTSKRLKRIMTGSCYDGTKNFEWIKKNTPYGDNLAVYEIKSVANFENAEGKTPFDVIDETLYNQTKFNTVKEKVEWVCSNFEGTQKHIENDVEYKKRMEDK